MRRALLGLLLAALVGTAALIVPRAAAPDPLPTLLATGTAAVATLRAAVADGTFDDVRAALYAPDAHGLPGLTLERGALEPDTPRAGTLEPMALGNDAYRFAGRTGQQVTLAAATGGAWNAALTLLDRRGDVWAVAFDPARLTATLPASVLYTVIVSDAGLSGGAYTLTLHLS